MDLIDGSLDNNYNEKLFGKKVLGNWNVDDERIVIEYFTNLFNTLKGDHVGSLLKESIKEITGAHKILIINSSFFNTIKALDRWC